MPVEASSVPRSVRDNFKCDKNHDVIIFSSKKNFRWLSSRNRQKLPYRQSPRPRQDQGLELGQIINLAEEGTSGTDDTDSVDQVVVRNEDTRLIRSPAKKNDFSSR